MQWNLLGEGKVEKHFKPITSGCVGGEMLGVLFSSAFCKKEQKGENHSKAATYCNYIPECFWLSYKLQSEASITIKVAL